MTSVRGGVVLVWRRGGELLAVWRWRGDSSRELASEGRPRSCVCFLEGAAHGAASALFCYISLFRCVTCCVVCGR